MELLKPRYKKNWLSRHGKQWTENDIKELIDLYESGASWGVIAQNLQRTIETCINRLRAVRFYYKLKTDIWSMDSEALTDEQMEIKKRK